MWVIKIYLLRSYYVHKKKKIYNNFGTMHQNSAPNNSIRPDELMSELGIKKDAYYKLDFGQKKINLRKFYAN